jgi:hypothetical protein
MSTYSSLKRFMFVAALAGVASLPTIVVAQTTAPITGSIVCRPVKADETANATVQNTRLLCHPLNLKRIRDAMVSAETNLSAGQKARMDAAMAILRDELMLEPTYPGFNGNPNN